jgi:peptide/nickel transport system substrate-binding protein
VNRFLAALLTTGVIAASACGGGGTSTTTSTSANPDPNGTFRFAATSSYDSLDPAKARVTNIQIWISPAYDSLVFAHVDGTYTAGLATEWAFVDNNSALQLKLRKGVTFHDGTALNAQAVKANLERNKGGAKASDLAPVTSVNVVDDLTVKLQLASGKGGTLLATLADSPGMMVSPAAFGNADLAQHPVGTGPFKWVSTTTSAITYERNPTYWGKKPSYKTLVIGVLPPSDITARINAVVTAAYDATFVSNGTPQPQLDQWKGQGIKIDQEFPAVFQYLNFNRSGPPLDNPMVRQAIGYAIDRQGIGKALNMQPTDEFAPPKSRYVVDKYVNYYTYDPAKAKKMLADAGYPNGFSTELDNPSYQSQFGQAVQAQLAAIGIKTTIFPLDSAPSITARCFVQQKCPIFAGAAIEQLDPTRLAEQNFQTGALQNMGGNVPPQVTAKLVAAQQPTSDAEHLTRARDLVAQQVIDAPLQIVVHVNSYVLYQPKISAISADWGFQGYPNYALVVVSK